MLGCSMLVHAHPATVGCFPFKRLLHRLEYNVVGDHRYVAVFHEVRFNVSLKSFTLDKFCISYSGCGPLFTIRMFHLLDHNTHQAPTATQICCSTAEDRIRHVLYLKDPFWPFNTFWAHLSPCSGIHRDVTQSHSLQR